MTPLRILRKSYNGRRCYEATCAICFLRRDRWAASMQAAARWFRDRGWRVIQGTWRCKSCAEMHSGEAA